MDRLIDRFLATRDRNRKHDRLIAEIWNRRNSPEAATYEVLTSVIWPQRKADKLENVYAFKTNLSRARAALSEFCSTDFLARRLPFTVSIGEKSGVYKIVQEKRTRPLVPCSEILWDSFITHVKAPLIISTEPLVFRDELTRCSFRFLDINAAPTDEMHLTAEIDAYLQGLGAQDPEMERVFRRVLQQSKPCYHYQPSGEVLAALSLETWLQSRLPPGREHGKGALRLLSRQVDPDRFRLKNAVILGNLRTNSLLRALQTSWEPPITINAKDVRVAGRTEPYRDNARTAFAVVTRVGRTDEARERLVIAANNGRALQAAAESLINDDDVFELFGKLDAASSFVIPPAFQVLYNVSLDQHNVQGDSCRIEEAVRFELRAPRTEIASRPV